jgi:hypothetical protein
VVKTPLLLPPSTATTVNNATIGAVESIPLLPPSTTTAIAAVEDHHCCCHTVDNNNPQKPAVVVCHQWQQSRPLSMEAAVDGNHGNGGLCQRRLLLTEAAVGWRNDDTIALSTMASLANGGSGNGGGCRQLCSSGWCRRQHPFIGVDGSGKDVIIATAINCRFHQGQLLLLPLTATIAAATQSMVNGSGGLSQRQQQRQGQTQLVLGCKDVL